MREAVPGTERVALGPAGTALLHDLCSCQEQLARSIARTNIGLRSSGIALVANRTVFRLCTLAIASDRGLVPEGLLEEIAGAGNTSRRLDILFGKSGDLWEGTGEDHRGKNPAIDDSVVTSVARRILSPDRLYCFSSISLEEIAAVFDRYCARTIRRSAAHQAVIADRADPYPARDPALLDYAAFATLAASRSSRSTEDPLPFRILDPACGSGGLLIRAYHNLVPGTSTFAEKTETLFQSIFGVDANPDAVAAARLLMALAACEGERTEFTPGDFFSVLGDLTRIVSGTIRCGNALVSPDIADDESWAFCPLHERRSIRSIDLREAFVEVLAPGGFDAVVCNPPDIPVPAREWLQQYFQRHYRVFDPGVSLPALYFERAAGLLRAGGTAGIVSDPLWLRSKAGTRLRGFLASRQVNEILLPGTGDACFVCFSHARPSRPLMVLTGIPAPGADPGGFPVPETELSAGGWVFRDTRSDRILTKIRAHGTPLETSVLGGIRCIVPPEHPRKNQIVFSLAAFPPRFRPSGRVPPGGPTGVIASGSLYLLGLLSSRLARFVFVERAGELPTPTEYCRVVGEFPVYTPDRDDPVDRARQDRLEALVREMLDLGRHERHARAWREKHLVAQEIDSTKKQIDSLVFGIYGLTVEDIAIVDSALALIPV